MDGNLEQARVGETLRVSGRTGRPRPASGCARWGCARKPRSKSSPTTTPGLLRSAARGWPSTGRRPAGSWSSRCAKPPEAMDAPTEAHAPPGPDRQPEQREIHLFNALTGGAHRQLRRHHRGPPRGDDFHPAWQAGGPGGSARHLQPLAAQPGRRHLPRCLVRRPARHPPPRCHGLRGRCLPADRHLYLVTQIIDLGLPVLVALNKMDAAERPGLRIDPGAGGRTGRAGRRRFGHHRTRGVELKRQLTDLARQPAPARRWTSPSLAKRARRGWRRAATRPGSHNRCPRLAFARRRELPGRKRHVPVPASLRAEARQLAAEAYPVGRDDRCLASQARFDFVRRTAGAPPAGRRPAGLGPTDSMAGLASGLRMVDHDRDFLDPFLAFFRLAWADGCHRRDLRLAGRPRARRRARATCATCWPMA